MKWTLTLHFVMNWRFLTLHFVISRSKLDETHNAIPIEVKSGVRISHRSLDKFRAKYADYVAESCLLSVHGLKVKDGITYLPLYMTPLLPDAALAFKETRSNTR